MLFHCQFCSKPLKLTKECILKYETTALHKTESASDMLAPFRINISWYLVPNRSHRQTSLHENTQTSSGLFDLYLKGTKYLIYVSRLKSSLAGFVLVAMVTATVYPWMLRTSLWWESCWAFVWQTFGNLFLACYKLIRNWLMLSEAIVLLPYIIPATGELCVVTVSH